MNIETKKPGRSKLPRLAKDKRASMSSEEAETSKTGSAMGGGDALNVIGQAFIKMNEMNNARDIKMNEINNARDAEIRRKMDEDKKDSQDTIKLLVDKLESLELKQMENIEAQRQTVKTPMPRYNGKAGEFDDWKQGVLSCIKNNGWTDENRILEILPSALSGQAARAFTSLSADQRATLSSTMAALKEALDPSCNTHNRELFMRAKRGPGESMRAFVGRCNEYIMRADELDTIEDSPWANPFIVEKIYANLSPLDGKILKNGAGKSQDVNLLTEKADELLARSEDTVGAAGAEQNSRMWYEQRWPRKKKSENQQTSPQQPQPQPQPMYRPQTPTYQPYELQQPHWGMSQHPQRQQNNFQRPAYQQEQPRGQWANQPQFDQGQRAGPGGDRAPRNQGYKNKPNHRHNQAPYNSNLN